MFLGGSHNTRNYFNPYLLKLEPITTDQARTILSIKVLSAAPNCTCLKDIYPTNN